MERSGRAACTALSTSVTLSMCYIYSNISILLPHKRKVRQESKRIERTTFTRNNLDRMAKFEFHVEYSEYREAQFRKIIPFICKRAILFAEDGWLFGIAEFKRQEYHFWIPGPIEYIVLEDPDIILWYVSKMADMRNVSFAWGLSNTCGRAVPSCVPTVRNT